MSYNGWRNYETWLCNIWHVVTFAQIAVESPPGTSTKDLARRLREELENEFWSHLARSSGGFLGDVFYGFLHNVDFEELAEHLEELIPKEEKGEGEEG